MSDTVPTQTPDDAPTGERNEQLRAAVSAAQCLQSTQIEIPGIGRVHVPPVDELGFMAGIGALAVVGALEWPVALVLGAGRLLTHAHRWRSVAAFGQALGRV